MGREIETDYIPHDDIEEGDDTTADGSDVLPTETAESDNESVQEMYAENHDRVSRLSFLSSLLFFAGAICLFIKQRVEIQENSFVYAFIILAVSVFPEFFIDYLSRRPFSHGRYSAVSRSQEVFGSDVVILNHSQSIIFLIAASVQAAAFFFYEELDDEYKVVTIYCDMNLSAAVFWILSGGMTLVMRGFTGCRCNHGVAGVLDVLANLIYTASTGVIAIAAMEQMEYIDYFDQENFGILFQGYAMDSWLVVGALYLISDVIRHRQGPQLLNLKQIKRRGRSSARRSTYKAPASKSLAMVPLGRPKPEASRKKSKSRTRR